MLARTNIVPKPSFHLEANHQLKAQYEHKLWDSYYVAMAHSTLQSSPEEVKFTSVEWKEDQNLTRAIKETLFIRVNDPSLNRNIGKYHLPHIWDEVLHKTSELKLKH